MKLTSLGCAFFFFLSQMSMGADMQQEPDGIPPTDGQVTMLYYKDISAAAAFYGDVLGFENTLDWEWVKFFRSSTDSFIGLVTEGDGAHHKVQPTNAVMVSIVTPDVDAWYERVSGKSGVRELKPVADRGPIRSFMLEDPGGYTVEFFQWLKPEQE